MDFDQIPSYNAGRPITDNSMRGWLARHRRALLALIGMIVLLDILAGAYFVLPAVLSGPPGGLDGCLLSASGQPVLATVKVGKVERASYEDGCFFFPALKPGPNQVSVETSAGEVWTQEIEIISGEAVALGTINLP